MLIKSDARPPELKILFNHQYINLDVPSRCVTKKAAVMSAGTLSIKLQLIWIGGPNVAAFAPEHSNYLSIVLFPQ